MDRDYSYVGRAESTSACLYKAQWWTQGGRQVHILPLSFHTCTCTHGRHLATAGSKSYGVTPVYTYSIVCVSLRKRLDCNEELQLGAVTLPDALDQTIGRQTQPMGLCSIRVPIHMHVTDPAYSNLSSKTHTHTND